MTLLPSSIKLPVSIDASLLLLLSFSIVRHGAYVPRSLLLLIRERHSATMPKEVLGISLVSSVQEPDPGRIWQDIQLFLSLPLRSHLSFLQWESNSRAFLLNRALADEDRTGKIDQRSWR
jgi:hypothetical protein